MSLVTTALLAFEGAPLPDISRRRILSENVTAAFRL